MKLKELSASNLSANYLQLAIHSDTQSRLEKHLCPWDKNLFSKRAKRKYHGSTATMPPRGCHLNKNLLFVLSNFEPCFLVWRSKSFSFFVWSAKKGGAKGVKP